MACAIICGQGDTLSCLSLYRSPGRERTRIKKRKKKDFPFTQEGLDAAIDWINQSYEQNVLSGNEKPKTA